MFSQLFNASGHKVGAVTALLALESSIQRAQSTVLSDGQLLIVWEAEGGLQAQYFDPMLGPAGDPVRLVDHSYKELVDLQSTNGGGFALTRLVNPLLPGFNDITNRSLVYETLIFNSRGQIQGEAVRTDTELDDWTLQNLQVVPYASGGVLTIRQEQSRFSRPHPEPNTRVLWERFNADGVSTGPAITVQESSWNNVSLPHAIVSLTSGRVGVLWSDYNDSLIRTQLFEVDGHTLSRQIVVEGGNLSQFNPPRLSALPDGGFVAIWGATGPGGEGRAIGGQRFDSQGQPAGERFFVNQPSGHYFEEITVTPLVDGRFVVGWLEANRLVDSINQEEEQRHWQIRGQILDGRSTPIQLEGTPGNDDYIGTPFADRILGSGGNDTLRGGAGNDTLIGGDGIDELQEQGDVNFTLSDSQLTGLGTDSLTSIERVSLSGGSGNNTLDASAFTRGPVALSGGAGDDHLIGPREAGTGHWPWGFYANRFTGGPGNDTFTGGVGSDAIVERGDTNFTLGATQLTGNGTDSFTSMDIAYLIGGQGDNRLDVAGFTGTYTVLEGRGGNDTLVGGVAHDWVRGQANGDFTLSDSRLSGDGVDTLIRIDAAILIGGAGANTLDVSAFSGALTILEGGAGDDTLIGRPDGLDRVRARGDVDFTLTDSQLTGQGSDSLQHIDQAVLIGGASANTLDVSAFTGALTILEGGAGDDTLIGRPDGLDRVRARGDVDFTLTDSQLTGQGTDSLQHIDQAVLIGGASANTLDASAFTLGSVFLYGESGDDTLRGGHGNDHLEGGPGDDLISGGAGRDRIVGRGDTNFTLSANQLRGLGTDSFDGVEEAHLIGGPGANTLDGSGFTGALVIYEGQGGDDILIGRANGNDRVRAVGDADFTLTDTQLTGLGTDTLNGIHQAQLIGYSGANRFDASAFTLGPVLINAGAGNDTLIGGAGNDTLTGGAGADRFRFATALNATTNRDVITDFSLAQGDTIELENAVFTAFTAAGSLAASAFFIGAAATTSAHRILYNVRTGLLAYDSDGNGAAAAVAFAKLTPGMALTSNQFSIT
ncbi:hypothetical protein H6G65_00775 [Microcystis elabens FACHB-917]|nr:hypothetical protein [Microcystis elabens FACHB-917]